MLQPNQMTHFIEKGNKLDSRPKLPFGHGRGDVSDETEARREFGGKGGQASKLLKTPDTINFGNNRNFETNYKEHYVESNNQKASNDEAERTQTVKNKVNANAKVTHVLQIKDEHPDKYRKSTNQDPSEVVGKPTKWIKGKNEKKDLEFKDQTTNKVHFQPVEDHVKQKVFTTYNNLKNASEIPSKDKSSYGENFLGKNPDVGAVKEQFIHNSNKGKNGHKFMANPSAPLDTAYNQHFEKNLKVDGTQNLEQHTHNQKAKELFQQNDKAFYYTDK